MSAIRGLKLIRFSLRDIDQPDDPSLPFLLEAIFCMPEAVIQNTGRQQEVLVMRSIHPKLFAGVINRLGLHEYLKRATITGPTGVILEVDL